MNYKKMILLKKQNKKVPTFITENKPLKYPGPFGF